MGVEVLCDNERCRHCNEDGECVRWRIQLDEDNVCIDFEEE